MLSRTYSLIIAIFTLLSFIGLLIVIFRLDPYDASFGDLSVLLFYMSFFFTLFGLSSLINFFTRKIITDYEISNHHLNVSLRQGAIIGLYFSLLLFFYDIGVFTPTNIILITLIMFLSEMYFWDE